MTAEEKAQFELGKNIYEIACLACHQPNGQGMEGLAPPLAGSEWLRSPPEHLIRIVLHGLRGPIKVKGQPYQLEMPTLGVLDDEQIAAALSFVRRAWGPDLSAVSPQTVKDVRAATASRGESWTIEELQKVPVEKSSAP
jgi:mono/diheme cytochrome c family protein